MTVEFWLKWNRFANDDALAMEFTPNFNAAPAASWSIRTRRSRAARSASGIGRGASRNNVFFPRPSAGVWHHYAFVLDTRGARGRRRSRPTSTASRSPTRSSTAARAAGSFANSTLYFMSRAGTALFGAGDLDEVAIYNRALSAATIADHYASSGTNRRPIAAFTLSQTRSR